MAPSTRHVYHSILRELGLDSSTTGKGNSKVSSLQVLDYLLKENVVKEASVRSAFDALSHPVEEAKSNPTNTIPTTDTECRRRHIALRFSYNGAEFSGLAQNLGQDSDNSVERALFEALMKAKLVDSRETSGYSRCGRTDRGVSAAGQVVALQLKSAIPLDASMDAAGEIGINPTQIPKNEFERIKGWVVPRKCKAQKDGTALRVEKDLTEYPYAKILNNLLPIEIRVLGWAPVSDDFSARFSATTRTYRYFFMRGLLDLDKMKSGLDLLVGRHDFRNFCKMDVEKVYNFERVIHAVALECIGGLGNNPGQVFYVQIYGQAFLWHQIRCIMEVLFMIGNGLEEPSVITKLFDIVKYPGKPNYPLAPEKPLVLNDCGYPNLQFGYSVQNIWNVTCQLEHEWGELILAAARIRNGIDGFRKLSVLRDDLLHFASGRIVERKRKLSKAGMDISDEPDESNLTEALSKMDPLISWEEALNCLSTKCKWIPNLNGLCSSIHIPLLRRSFGTTYEQKVAALQKSEKRKAKYEENVIKKRKSAEEDAAFYFHKAQQGGKGM